MMGKGGSGKDTEVAKQEELISKLKEEIKNKTEEYKQTNAYKLSKLQEEIAKDDKKIAELKEQSVEMMGAFSWKVEVKKPAGEGRPKPEKGMEAVLQGIKGGVVLRRTKTRSSSPGLVEPTTPTSAEKTETRTPIKKTETEDVNVSEWGEEDQASAILGPEKQKPDQVLKNQKIIDNLNNNLDRLRTSSLREIPQETLAKYEAQKKRGEQEITILEGELKELAAWKKEFDEYRKTIEGIEKKVSKEKPEVSEVQVSTSAESDQRIPEAPPIEADVESIPAAPPVSDATMADAAAGLMSIRKKVADIKKGMRQRQAREASEDRTAQVLQSRLAGIRQVVAPTKVVSPTSAQKPAERVSAGTPGVSVSARAAQVAAQAQAQREKEAQVRAREVKEREELEVKEREVKRVEQEKAAQVQREQEEKTRREQEEKVAAQAKVEAERKEREAREVKEAEEKTRREQEEKTRREQEEKVAAQARVEAERKAREAKEAETRAEEKIRLDQEEKYRDESGRAEAQALRDRAAQIQPASAEVRPEVKEREEKVQVEQEGTRERRGAVQIEKGRFLNEKEIDALVALRVKLTDLINPNLVVNATRKLFFNFTALPKETREKFAPVSAADRTSAARIIEFINKHIGSDNKSKGEIANAADLKKFIENEKKALLDNPARLVHPALMRYLEETLKEFTEVSRPSPR